MLYFLLAGFALGQLLPYQYAYKNERGWKEMMIFEQSPNDPNVILVSLYSYVEAQVPYYKLKETKPAGDTKKALVFIAQHQAAEAQEAQNRANRPVTQAPVWKRFVTNENFRKANRADIADEIRRQDGDAVADHFLAEERLKDLDKSIADGRREAEESDARNESMRRRLEMQQQETERKQREIERKQEEIERRQREIER